MKAIHQIIVATSSLILAACSVIEQPVVRPFPDGKNWVLMRPLDFDIPEADLKGTVPAGFVTDFASIPRLGWSILSPYGPYAPAAIVHDYLYWVQPCTREQADRALLEGMRESEVPIAKRESIYHAVDLAGGFAWRSNAKERAQGLTKFIPTDKLNSIPPKVTWDEYRKTLTSNKL